MVSIGLIGFGRWGKNHYKALTDIDGINVPLVCDPLLEERTVGNTKFVKDYREAIDRDDVDAMIVATHATTHYKISRDLLLSGKHLLVEKPITTNLRDGKELCDIADEKDKVLMVGEIFRFNPAVNYIAKGINDGVIGDVRYFEARRIGLGPIRHDVNVVWDLASHDFYLSNLFTSSRPETVAGHGVSFNGNVEDVATLALKFPGNKFGSIYVNWGHPIKERTIVIGGTKGAFVFDDVSLTDKVRLYSRGVDYQPDSAGMVPFLASIRSGDINIPSIDLRSSPLDIEVGHFVKCITQGVHCVSSGRIGLEAIAILEAAKESMNNKGIEVPVNYAI